VESALIAAALVWIGNIGRRMKKIDTINFDLVVSIVSPLENQY
jgi:hypothetical protein